VTSCNEIVICIIRNSGPYHNYQIFSWSQASNFPDFNFQGESGFFPWRNDYSSELSQLRGSHGPGFYDQEHSRWKQFTVSSIGPPHKLSQVDVGSLQSLRSNLSQCISIKGWFVLSDESPDKIQFCTHGMNNFGSPMNTFTIEIHATHEWQLKLPSGVLEKEQHHLLQFLPLCLRTVTDVKVVTDLISRCKNCQGICDEKYGFLIEKQKGRLFWWA